ncbi:hypothetical protein B0A67_24670 [Flavobacterium aquidurense]|nr:hypothetical protein B0A67_24670 [Flavobacterium aquidurense]
MKNQSIEFKSNEFEFYWEIWGVWWMSWFIEVDGKSLNFIVNDISNKDLDELIEKGFIKLVKVY